MRKIRYVIIGFGGIAEHRIAQEGFGCDRSRFDGHPRAELIGATDADAARQGAVAGLGLTWYDSVDALLSDSEVEAVFIATNNLSHAPLGVKAIQAGKHCLIEKPIATSFEDAIRLHTDARDYFPSLSPAQKKDRLMRMSYYDFVVDVVGCEPEVATLYSPYVNSLFAAGVDVIPAIYGYEMGFPGFAGMQLPETPPALLVNEPGGQHGRENAQRARQGDPDIYFPDGNATIARLLVSSLVPGSIPANTMESIQTARVNYGQLDQPGNNVRIRLNSTAVNVAHSSSSGIEVSYARDGEMQRVRGQAAVLACWNGVIPYLCPELPAHQKKALADGVKAPVVYTSVLLSNWRCFVDAGVSYVAAPGGYHTTMSLSTPLELGAYRTSASPDEPIVLGMGRYPCKPGLSRREQHRAGQKNLLDTSLETFETEIFAQLDAMFSPHGLDVEQDVLAITVNRWPHGYTYSYNPLFDPVEWAYTTSEQRPNVIGRQRHGRIAIANADAAASPHTDSAINEAYRAVSELASAMA